VVTAGFWRYFFTTAVNRRKTAVDRRYRKKNNDMGISKEEKRVKNPLAPSKEKKIDIC